MDRLLFFRRSVWPLTALLLIAFGLRVYHLDAQRLWSDEGLSLYRARLPLDEILSNIIVVPPGVPTRDTNPPFTLSQRAHCVCGVALSCLVECLVMATDIVKIFRKEYD